MGGNRKTSKMENKNMSIESPIFTPVTIGPVTLRNRVIRSAAFENMAYGNSPSQDLYDYHVAVARVGVGS